jgi:hypothetical protein
VSWLAVSGSCMAEVCKQTSQAQDIMRVLAGAGGGGACCPHLLPVPSTRQVLPDGPCHEPPVCTSCGGELVPLRVYLVGRVLPHWFHAA